MGPDVPTIRLATADDSERLFAWRNDPDTRRASHNTDVVPLERHAEWFEKSLQRSDRIMLIAMLHERADRNGSFRQATRLISGSQHQYRAGSARKEARRGVPWGCLRFCSDEEVGRISRGNQARKCCIDPHLSAMRFSWNWSQGWISSVPARARSAIESNSRFEFGDG